MKRFVLLSLMFFVLAALRPPCLAQETASIDELKGQIQRLETLDEGGTLSEDARAFNHTFLEERRVRLRALLQKRIAFLRQYRDSAGAVLTSRELSALDTTLSGLRDELKETDATPAAAQASAPQTQPTPQPKSDDDDEKGSILKRLADKGLSLQRAVTGDDATEGASFAFLRTFKKNTVFSTDFALIWNPELGRPLTFSRTVVRPEFSLEGHLTSDESDAEDAWRLRAVADFRTTFRTKRLSGMHNHVGAKFEADQRFVTKKLMFDYLFTPTWVKAGIGKYLGNDRETHPVSFRWRPYFGLDAGHTFERGEAAIPEETILRFVPRLRAEFRLNFIDWALKSHRTLLYFDDKFYFLPLEDSLRTPNFLVSGLEIGFNKNVGLGFKYKNGKEAPKFQRIHTFGGEFTFRFGKNAQ